LFVQSYHSLGVMARVKIAPGIISQISSNGVNHNRTGQVRSGPVGFSW